MMLIFYYCFSQGTAKPASDDMAISSSMHGSQLQLQSNGIRKKPDSEPVKPIWGASHAANARRSRSSSSTDLRKTETPTNKHCHEVPSYLRRKPKPLLPQEESVYNWRFMDSNNLPPNLVEQQKQENPDKFAKFQNAKDLHVHRVEYLPCDGICAEETVVGGQNGDSGRSSSSSRTSRGMNTDETRIYQTDGMRPAQSLDRFEESVDAYEASAHPPSMFSKGRLIQPQTMNQSQQSMESHQSRFQRIEHGQGDGPITESFSNMKLNGGGKPSKTISTSTLSQNGPGGDQLPHSLGVVPK